MVNKWTHVSLQVSVGEESLRYLAETWAQQRKKYTSDWYVVSGQALSGWFSTAEHCQWSGNITDWHLITLPNNIYVISTVTGYKMRRLVTSKLNYYDSVGRILRCVSITVNTEKIQFVQATTTYYITLARLNQLTVNTIFNTSSLFKSNRFFSK